MTTDAVSPTLILSAQRYDIVRVRLPFNPDIVILTRYSQYITGGSCNNLFKLGTE
jgi:hypothetical protein